MEGRVSDEITDDDSMVNSSAVVDDTSISSDTSHCSDIPISPISSDDVNEQLPSPDSYANHSVNFYHSGDEMVHLRNLKKT